MKEEVSLIDVSKDELHKDAKMEALQQHKAKA